MYLVSSGFEEWIHLFVQDSFGQKRETLPGAIVIRVEPTSSMYLTLQSCDSTNQIVVSTFRHQHTETRLKLPHSFPKESGEARLTVCVGMSVVSKMRRRDYVAYAHALSQFWVVKIALAWTKKKRSLRNGKLKTNRASETEERGKKG